MKRGEFVCVAAGSGSIKLGQFRLGKRLSLTGWTSKTLPPGIENALPAAFEEATKGRHLSAQNASLCGYSSLIYTKILKIPPVDSGKIRQMIFFEAQQNLPFPMEDAVWDFQVLNSPKIPSDSGNAQARNNSPGPSEILLAGARSDAVESFFRAGEASGLRFGVIDCPVAALHNAFRFNYAEVRGCTLLLDIGAKSTNLLIFGEGEFFARTIPLGSHSITSEFMGEAKVPFTKAEALKIERGFVNLTGAYEEPENAREAALAKIARQFMTRLHTQVSQTLHFYRQQGGSIPERLLLAGGGSSLPFTAEFFAEKLNLPVEYFNPFRRIEIEPSVSAEDLGRNAHCLGELVGLALREFAQCPIELNLLPKSIRRRNDFARKRPFLAVSITALGLCLLMGGLFEAEIATIKRDALVQITPKLRRLQARAAALKAEEDAIKSAHAEIQSLSAHLQEKFVWADFLTDMRERIISTEEAATKATGQATGVWIEKLTSENAPEPEEESTPYGLPSAVLVYLQMHPELAPQYLTNGLLRGYSIAPQREQKPDEKKTFMPNLFATFRAVSLNTPDHPAENSGLAYLVERQFQSLPQLDPKETKLQNLQPDDGEFTFTFDMQLKPAR